MSNGHLIRSYRQGLGLSCKDFAERMSIPEPTLRSLENGSRIITAERAKEIEDKTNGELTRHALRPDIFASLRAQA